MTSSTSQLFSTLQLRKLRGVVLSPHLSHGDFPLPMHPSCGFVVDTSMVSTAIGFLVALHVHTEEVTPGQRLNVKVIGSISGRGVFWVRIMADDCDMQDIKLMNISVAMR